MMMLEETNGQQMPSIHPNNFGLFTAGNFDPCHVCGEASSGWHCGAITCEACKVRYKSFLFTAPYFD